MDNPSGPSLQELFAMMTPKERNDYLASLVSSQPLVRAMKALAEETARAEDAAFLGSIGIKVGGGTEAKMATVKPKWRIEESDYGKEIVLRVISDYNEEWREAAGRMKGRWKFPVNESSWQFIVPKHLKTAFHNQLVDALENCYGKIPSQNGVSLDMDRPAVMNRPIDQQTQDGKTAVPAEKIAEIVKKHVIPGVKQEVREFISSWDDEFRDIMRTENQKIANVADSLNARMSVIDEKLDRVLRPVVIHQHIGQQVVTKDLGCQHRQFAELLELTIALPPEERNIWLAGPAGSGKTTACAHIAEALDLEFEYNGAIDTEYKLSGFINAAGNYVDTPFYRAWTEGKVYLFDEIDASLPGALLAFNGALSSDVAPFPNGMKKRHKNCIIFGAANTWGHGGDAKYVGRMRQDAAFLDRYVTMEWEYDEAFESALADSDEWVRVVQRTRQLVIANGADMVVSPRASIKGSHLLRAGMSHDRVVKYIFGRYRAHSKWNAVGRYVEEFARSN